MKLISLSLTNIGPFRDQTITVHFRQGSYLIKAPIGSGKSFVFFDGPTFALYKKSKRPMLNMQSKSGQIICTFEAEGQVYIVQRDITKTKTGESIKSKLYSNDKQLAASDKELFTISEKNTDSLMLGNSATLLDFKNEIDLQQSLNGLLPPMEVFLGTQMLMQDTANIFELDPKDRLEIFKNVFNLIGIDEAKEKIAEHKRDITAMIKARADTSNYDQKAKGYIQNLIESWGDLTGLSDKYQLSGSKTESEQREKMISDRKLLQDKLTIDLLSLSEQEPNLAQLLNLIESSHTEIITLQTQKISKEEQLQQKIQEQQSLSQQHTTTQQQLEKYTQEINNYDPQQLERLTLSLQEIQYNKESLHTQLDQTSISTTIKKFYASCKDNAELLSILDRAIQSYKQEDERSLLKLQELLTELKNIAKDYTHQLSFTQQSLDNTKQQEQSLHEQLQKANERIDSFQQDIEGQKIFRCERIQENCPYIDLINASTFKKLNNQLQLFVTERDALKLTISNIHQGPTDYTKQLQYLQYTIDQLKDFFTLLNRKQIDELVTQYHEYTKQSHNLQSQRSLLQTKAQHITSIKEQISSLQSTLASLGQQQKTITQQQQVLQEDYILLKEKIDKLPLSHQLQHDKELIVQYQNNIDRLRQIITDFKTSQGEFKQLKEKEKILSDLYQIFARELLLIVVQKNLPKLQDLMNSYLSQVVDYQLEMTIDKKSTNSESIDLFVTISDEKGPREVKSLSGGQKVILKIVWMMAVATVMRSQMLFLDETINNLDGDTIAKVAELLKNFVEGKGKEFMLYVVTHSHQIQEMNIWDETVELRKD